MTPEGTGYNRPDPKSNRSRHGQNQHPLQRSANSASQHHTSLASAPNVPAPHDWPQHKRHGLLANNPSVGSPHSLHQQPNQQTRGRPPVGPSRPVQQTGVNRAASLAYRNAHHPSAQSSLQATHQPYQQAFCSPLYQQQDLAQYQEYQAPQSQADRPRSNNTQSLIQAGPDHNLEYALSDEEALFLYPRVPATQTKPQLMLHPIRYLPPTGTFLNMLSLDVVLPEGHKGRCMRCQELLKEHQPPVRFHGSFQQCTAPCPFRHVAIKAGDLHSDHHGQPCPLVYIPLSLAIRRWKFNVADPWYQDLQRYPTATEWDILKANGFIVEDSAYNPQETPQFTSKCLSMRADPQEPSISGNYRWEMTRAEQREIQSWGERPHGSRATFQQSGHMPRPRSLSPRRESAEPKQYRERSQDPRQRRLHSRPSPAQSHGHQASPLSPKPSSLNVDLAWPLITELAPAIQDWLFHPETRGKTQPAPLLYLQGLPVQGQNTVMINLLNKARQNCLEAHESYRALLNLIFSANGLAQVPAGGFDPRSAVFGSVEASMGSQGGPQSGSLPRSYEPHSSANHHDPRRLLVSQEPDPMHLDHTPSRRESGTPQANQIFLEHRVGSLQLNHVPLRQGPEFGLPTPVLKTEPEHYREADAFLDPSIDLDLALQNDTQRLRGGSST
ncbi:hypothetical protein NX059_006497 [Plenodomus lindquistii]|nr:hypothetical protein NX059_006497 [Plenodomus lindquistii]